jgi:hypothetical protein
MSLRHYNRNEFGELYTKKIGKRKWELTQDWQTPFGVVPKGFISNGANVPRFLWWFLDPATEAFEASVIHDYFYDNAIQTKAFADLAFYQVLRTYGVSQHKAQPAYWAVKQFGNGKYPRRT